MNQESFDRYATAKEYIEAVKLTLTSPHYRDKHIMIAIRPTHLLVGFGLELFLKAWLLADGLPSKPVEKLGHKLLDLYTEATSRGFSADADIKRLIEHMAEPHGQNRDYVYRYTKSNAQIVPLIWNIVLPTLHKIDIIVDTHVGASASLGLRPGR